MAKHKQHVAGAEGWSDWDTPVMERYKISCCDCGLVHDMDFKVLEVVKYNKDGTWTAIDVEDDYRVEIRLRRNNRSTGQVRRHMKGQADAGK